MIHSKNRNAGFTLIEVMLSIMIVGLLLAPLSLMYTMIVQRVHSSSKMYNLILMGKNFLYEARQKQDVNAQDFFLEKQELNVDASVTYTLDKGVDSKSTLTSLEGLHKETVAISWLQDGQKKQERLVAFVYKKPEQKKS